MGEKKILILGGSYNQMPLIQAAKEEGYEVILCDWTTTNPGIALADKHYQVNAMDRDAVLQIAKQEKVDGVISNSEPMMSNVAYLSEQLGLVGNPESAINQFTSKPLFRKFQKRCGLVAPDHFIASNEAEALEGSQKLNYPIIIKPCKSSGSRGTTRLDEFNEERVLEAFRECQSFSEDQSVCFEEFFTMPTLAVLEADFFVHDGSVYLYGLFDDYRSEKRPMVPQTDIYPAKVSNQKRQEIQNALQTLCSEAGIRHGEYDAEMFYTLNDELFIIEINVRQGGTFIPLHTEHHCGVKMSKLLVTTAVGDDAYFNHVCSMEKDSKYICYHSVFSEKSGVLKGIEIDPSIQPYVIGICDECVGTEVEACINAASEAGGVELEFPDEETQMKYCCRLNDLIWPIIE